MLRSVLAVLSGPVVYGIVCVPSNGLVVAAFPGQFDDQWYTQHQGMLVLMVSLTIFYAGISGFVAAWIAKRRILAHAAALSALQLAVGIGVQLQYWNSLPLWYHLSFFALLVIGIALGALVYHNWVSRMRFSPLGVPVS